MTERPAQASENERAVAPSAVMERQHTWTPAVWLTLLVVCLVHLLPRVLLGQDSVVTIHDNLDSDFAYRVVIAQEGRMWNAHAWIPELLGGLPRSVYPSPAKLSSLLFWAFPPFTAYVLLALAVRAIAFLGMHALLRDHLPTPPRPANALLVAATFATLPFYVIYDASIAGQPMVAWALMNLARQRRWRASLLVLVSFGFVSVLPTSGAFVVAAALVAASCVALATRRFDRLLALGIATLIFGCVLSDPWFIATVLHPPYGSQRSAWLAPGSSNVLDWSRVLHYAGHTFLYGRYHSSSVHTPILALTVLTVCIELWRRRWRSAALLLALVALSYVLAVSGPLGSWGGLRPLWNAFPFARTVHVRFHWLLPTLWFVTLGLLTNLWTGDWIATAARRWPVRARVLSVCVPALLVLNLGFVATSKVEAENELVPSYEAVLAHLRGQRFEEVTYRAFVAHDLFAAIERYIGKPKTSYRVISIGLHPNVAVLNGFQVADGYHDNYPLSYKRRWARLIAPELVRDPKRRAYVKDWGSRAYVYLAGQSLQYLDERQVDRPVLFKHVQLDPGALGDLHVRYVLSAYVLVSPERNCLRFERRFEDPHAAWRVQLYSVLLGLHCNAK